MKLLFLLGIITSVHGCSDLIACDATLCQDEIYARFCPNTCNLCYTVHHDVDVSDTSMINHMASTCHQLAEQSRCDETDELGHAVKLWCPASCVCSDAFISNDWCADATKCQNELSARLCASTCNLCHTLDKDVSDATLMNQSSPHSNFGYRNAQSCFNLAKTGRCGQQHVNRLCPESCAGCNDLIFGCLDDDQCQDEFYAKLCANTCNLCYTLHQDVSDTSMMNHMASTCHQLAENNRCGQTDQFGHAVKLFCPKSCAECNDLIGICDATMCQDEFQARACANTCNLCHNPSFLDEDVSDTSMTNNMASTCHQLAENNRCDETDQLGIPVNRLCPASCVCNDVPQTTLFACDATMCQDEFHARACANTCDLCHTLDEDVSGGSMTNHPYFQSTCHQLAENNRCDETDTYGIAVNRLCPVSCACNDLIECDVTMCQDEFQARACATMCNLCHTLDEDVSDTSMRSHPYFQSTCYQLAENNRCGQTDTFGIPVNRLCPASCVCNDVVSTTLLACDATMCQDEFHARLCASTCNLCHTLDEDVSDASMTNNMASTCHQLAENNRCDETGTFGHTVRLWCPFSCDPVCHDIIGVCHDLVCQDEVAARLCARTCNLCHTLDEDVSDASMTCNDIGTCDVTMCQNEFQARACANTCGLCHTLDEDVSDASMTNHMASTCYQLAENNRCGQTDTFGIPVNRLCPASCSCAEYDEWSLCDTMSLQCNTSPFVRKVCPRTCKTCGVCGDLDEITMAELIPGKSCSDNDECDTDYENGISKQQLCPKTCEICGTTVTGANEYAKPESIYWQGILADNAELPQCDEFSRQRCRFIDADILPTAVCTENDFYWPVDGVFPDVSTANDNWDFAVSGRHYSLDHMKTLANAFTNAYKDTNDCDGDDSPSCMPQLNFEINRLEILRLFKLGQLGDFSLSLTMKTHDNDKVAMCLPIPRCGAPHRWVLNNNGVCFILDGDNVEGVYVENDCQNKWWHHDTLTCQDACSWDTPTASECRWGSEQGDTCSAGEYYYDGACQTQPASEACRYSNPSVWREALSNCRTVIQKGDYFNYVGGLLQIEPPCHKEVISSQKKCRWGIGETNTCTAGKYYWGGKCQTVARRTIELSLGDNPNAACISNAQARDYLQSACAAGVNDEACAALLQGCECSNEP